ncbi:MAG: AMP-binding protein [Alphaproteobacteria bacterium]|nr:AMP-binding protein [Alphaproteobacteria bacterium]
MPAATILDNLVRRLGERPDDVFAEVTVAESVTTLTVGGLVDAAERWAARLVELGCRPGDVVIVILKHGPDIYPAYLGAMIAGCVPSFMPFPTPKQDPALYWRSHDTLFRRIAARCIVTYAENAAQLEAMISVRDYAVCVAGSERGLAPLKDWRVRGGANVALLQHSSGTTGLKKGVALSHDAILFQIDAYSKALGFEAGDTIASWLPLYHDMGLIACFMLPLIAGGTIASLDAFEWVARPAMLLEEIARRRARWTWLPNFAFHHLVRTRGDETYDLSSMRAFIDCSEPCKPETFDEFAAAFDIEPAKLQTCYAMAETVFAVTQTRPGVPPRRLTRDGRDYLSCGPAIEGLEIRIIDGEIAVKGSCLFSGYYKLEEETRAAFSGEWYRSGDLGFMDGGELFVTGRIKDLIIVNGRNFYAHDVEAVVNTVAGIKPGRAVAIGRYSEMSQSEELLVIAETEAAETLALRKSVRDAIEAAFGLTGASVHVVAPGWLVKTTSGKISRSENLAKYQAEKRRLPS